MKATFAIALIALFITSSSAFESCLAFSGLNAFNLCPFAKKHVNFTVKTSALLINDNITFSIADDHVSSSNGTQVYAVYNEVHKEEQYIIANKLPEHTLINKDNSTEGLVITYPAIQVQHGDNDVAFNDTRQVVVVLKCNMAKTLANETVFSDAVITAADAHTTLYTITGESRFACPGSADFLWDFVKENKTIFASVLLALGSLFNFFGFKLVKFTIFSITAVIGFCASGMFLYSQVDVTTKKPVFWVLALLCVTLGLALGYAAHKLRQVAVFIVGAALGLVGGYVLYTGVVDAMLGHPPNSTTYLYITQVLCALIAGILAFVLNEVIFIVSTSVVGSYLVAVAIALFTGQFHNEDIMGNDFEFGQYRYFYLAGIIILSGCGIYYQHVSKAKNQEEIEKKDDAPKYGYAYYRY